jgi:hypothetical protein
MGICVSIEALVYMLIEEGEVSLAFDVFIADGTEVLPLLHYI